MAPPTTPPYGERLLEMGLKGLDVWELQIKLLGWGSGSDNEGIGAIMDPVRVTGEYDATTRDAVMRFQKAHSLTVTGVVDGPVYRAIDREAALHPVMIADLKCDCTRGINDTDEFLCRCGNHEDKGKCTTGFGKGRFDGKFLHDDHDDLKTEKLLLYDKKEYDGMDKAVIWAVRGLIHRAGIDKVKIVVGYSCWHQNYHTTDVRRWRHRRSTFHLGKTIEIIHPGTCTFEDDKACAACDAIRTVARTKCGFQQRWHEAGRISVAEGVPKGVEPITLHSVHVDTVMREVVKDDRRDVDWVKTDDDANKPIYENKVVGVSYPVDLGGGTDARSVDSGPFFKNVEDATAGWYPVGAGRIWHGGVNLKVAAGTEVRAMADGEIVGFRAGEGEEAKAHGSRNFVLIKHTWPAKDKVFYSLYMHLDEEQATGAATVRWRKEAHARSVAHLEALTHGAIYIHDTVNNTLSTLAQKGLAKGDRVATSGAELDPQTLDPKAPQNSKVIKLTAPADAYVFTNREGTDVAKLQASGDPASLAADLAGKVVGLEKPIPVSAGEVIGKVGKAPTDAALKPLGEVLHLEVFAEEALLSGEGYVTIDASDKAKIADRAEVVKALVAAKLIAEPQDGVLLQKELTDLIQKDANRVRFRSVVLKAPSAWELDWKDAFSQAKSLGHMQDGARDGLGTAINEYGWWKDVKDKKGSLPASEVVHHFHPIAFLMQVAFTE